MKTIQNHSICAFAALFCFLFFGGMLQFGLFMGAALPASFIGWLVACLGWIMWLCLSAYIYCACYLDLSNSNN